MNRNKIQIIVALLLATPLLIWGGTFRADENGLFPHPVHLEEGSACDDCHQPAEKADSMVVKKDGCVDCHDEEVPGYQPRKHSESIVRFPHKLHAEAGECKDCHGEDAGKLKGRSMTFGECTACHKENGVEVDAKACAACHGKSKQNLVPKDHRGHWETTHGKAAQWRVFERHGKDCSACHGKASCDTCHKTKRPRSHTGLWRIRMHGTAASWDRDSCKVCHETGTCIACHKSTPPLNHVGSWRTTRHMFSARDSSDQKRCAVCHDATFTATCTSCHSGR
jgi:hypothetical protein